METKINLILLIHTMYLLKLVSSNYYDPNFYYQTPSHHDDLEYEEVDDYDTETRHHRRRDSHGKHYSSHTHIHGDYHEDCSEKLHECSCDKCDNPMPCCENTCASCTYMSGQPNVVFVPYPYPLIVPGAGQNATEIQRQTTTPKAITTTTERITTTEKITTSSEVKIPEDIEMSLVRTPMKMKGRSRYMLTSLRRTKPTWVPKYGIVPIPDNLAEKLMSQLREVKEFNNKRDRAY